MKSLFAIIFATFIFFDPVTSKSLSYLEEEDSAVNYRRKPGKTHIEKSIQQANEGDQSQRDWWNRENCRVEDSRDECRRVENGTTCFGALIPYSHWSTKHMETLKLMQPLITEHLEEYSIYSGLPTCWRSLRELLCYTFYPPCKNGFVLRVSKTLCKDARRKCSFLVDNGLWPNAIGDCTYSNETTPEDLSSVFSDCSVARNITWKQNLSCLFPLTESKFNTGWIVDECGLNCTAARIELAEPFQGLLIIVIAIIFAYTLLTFIILHLEKPTYKIRASYFRPLYHFLRAHLILSICWIIQLTSDAPTVCRNDGSLRLREPSRREPLHAGLICVIEYIVLVGNSISASFYLIAFAFLHWEWRRDPKKRRASSYIHLYVILGTICLTATGIATTQVDGDPVLFACFISKSTVYGPLVYIAPIAISSIVATIFGILGRSTAGNKPSDNLDDRTIQTPKLFQIGTLFMILMSIAFTSTVGIVVDMQDDYNQKVKDFVKCSLRRDTHCPPFQTESTIRLRQMQVLCMCLPALVVDVWLFVCCNFGERLKRLIKCRCRRKGKSIESNDNRTMTEMTPLSTAGGVEDGNNLRNPAQRSSLVWSSTTSIQTDPELDRVVGRHERRRDFMDRVKNNNLHARLRTRSSGSLPLNSITPASLVSGRLPSNIMSPGSATLPFPDLSKYPMTQNGAPNNWWPYGWPPFSVWPWPCYQQLPPPSGSTSTPNSSIIAPPAISIGATQESTSGAVKDDETKIINVVANRSPPSTVSPNSYYWPYPYPPFPYWPPSTQPHLPQENQVTIRPMETSPSIATAAEASKEEEKSSAEVEEKVANEEASKKEEPGSIFNENQYFNESKNYDDESEEDGEHLDSEDDEEDCDSDTMDPDEEKFVEEQLSMLLKKNEACK